jgi:type IV pilus assembly protein PilO
MNLMEELRTLNVREPGRWPFAIRAVAVAVCFVHRQRDTGLPVRLAGSHARLQNSEDQEVKLRAEYKDKHAKAVNLALYTQQLADIEKSFGALLRQLAQQDRGSEPAGRYLADRLGRRAGREAVSARQEVKKDFYAELPIHIQLTGSYHEFGAFVSGIAALPRIVTLHDIQITPIGKSGSYDQLQLDLTAKTYRYLDDDEVAAAEAEKRKADAAKRHGT